MSDIWKNEASSPGTAASIHFPPVIIASYRKDKSLLIGWDKLLLTPPAIYANLIAFSLSIRRH